MKNEKKNQKIKNGLKDQKKKRKKNTKRKIFTFYPAIEKNIIFEK